MTILPDGLKKHPFGYPELPKKDLIKIDLAVKMR